MRHIGFAAVIIANKHVKLFCQVDPAFFNWTEIFDV